MPSLYPFQRQAVDDLNNGARLVVIGTGCGKSAVMMTWLKETEKKRILIVTTPSKVKSGDFIKEAETWCGKGWVDSLTSFEVISWHKLKKWKEDHLGMITG